MTSSSSSALAGPELVGKAPSGEMRRLNDVYGWLAHAAPGDHINWRCYVQSGPTGADGRPILLVVWDGSSSRCRRCEITGPPPVPVYLDDDGRTVKPAMSRHDCGAELANARHVVRWLSEITGPDDVRRLLASLNDWRPLPVSHGLQAPV